MVAVGAMCGQAWAQGGAASTPVVEAKTGEATAPAGSATGSAAAGGTKAEAGGKAGEAKAGSPLEDKGFFPRAVWYIGSEHAAVVAELGCNMYVCGGFREVVKEMGLVWGHGLYNIMRYSGRAELDRGVRGHASFVAWSNLNEPDLVRRVTPPEPLERLYKSIKGGPASGPVYINFTHPLGNVFAQPVSNEWYRRYCAANDILMYDYYPVNLAPMGYTRLWLVAVGMDRLAFFGGTKKARWNWIEVTNIQSRAEGPGFHTPTPEEIRAEVWISIIHGASGIGYFTHAWNVKESSTRGKHMEVWIPEAQRAAMKRVNAELKELAPAINSGECGLPLEKVEDQEGRVDLSARYDGKDLYIFAANLRQGPEGCTFTVPGLKAGAEVEVINEGRKREAGAGGKFHDRFAGFDVNLYRVREFAMPKIERGPGPALPAKVQEGFESRLGPWWDNFHDVVRTDKEHFAGERSLAVVPYGRAALKVAAADRPGRVAMAVKVGATCEGKMGPFFGVGNANGDMVLVSPKGAGWRVTATAEKNFRAPHEVAAEGAKAGEWNRWEFVAEKGSLKVLCNGREVALPEGFWKYFAGGLSSVSFYGDEGGKEGMWADELSVDLSEEGAK